MKNFQILPIVEMSLNDFQSKVVAIAKLHYWKPKDKKDSNTLFFTTASNFDNLFGSIIELKFLNSNTGLILVSSKNKLQVAESGDSTNRILAFVEAFKAIARMVFLIKKSLKTG